MKRTLAIFLCISAILMSAATPESFGQIVASNDFDRDFMMLRSTVTPDFRHHYDDYTQYAPAALMVGLKACGYHGRSDWGRSWCPMLFPWLR